MGYGVEAWSEHACSAAGQDLAGVYSRRSVLVVVCLKDLFGPTKFDTYTLSAGCGTSFPGFKPR